MKQVNYVIKDINKFVDFLASEEIQSQINSKAQLIQVYSAQTDSKWYYTLGKLIQQQLPNAIIVGASSVGEIAKGKINLHSTIALFSFFNSAELQLFSLECPYGTEERIGTQLRKELENKAKPIKGLMLLSNPIHNDAGKMFNTLLSNDLSFPIFGGGAGDYANNRKSIVFDGNKCMKEGFVAVSFSGDNLFIENLTYLEWHPFSKEMTITDAGDKCIKTINNAPAFSVYKKYLGIEADEHFFVNSMEFPFLLNRNNNIVARTPFFVDKGDGSIRLVADVKKGEKFRIGYGNPQIILNQANNIHKRMEAFKPDAVFLFSCICRRFLMQQDVDQETLPFERIAPTAGFYTFGEYYSNSEFGSLLNSTMVSVGIREGNIDNLSNTLDNKIEEIESLAHEYDPYSNQHSRILSRMLYFTQETSKEIEEQNKLLVSLNQQKDEFLGIAAHDLRNPLANILGFTDILVDNVGGDLKRMATIIKKESNKMLSLLNELLDISKIESGNLKIKKYLNDYHHFIDETIDTHIPLANQKRIEINKSFNLKTVSFTYDPDKIQQALNNLIGNAIKYSYANSVITINVFQENKHIVTEVIDQGQGIAPNQIDQIFIPFKRSDSKPTAGESSHGLGLAIVKKIIQAHGGEIGVKSELGKGSTFYIKLPL